MGFLQLLCLIVGFIRFIHSTTTMNYHENHAPEIDPAINCLSICDSAGGIRIRIRTTRNWRRDAGCEIWELGDDVYATYGGFLKWGVTLNHSF